MRPTLLLFLFLLPAFPPAAPAGQKPALRGASSVKCGPLQAQRFKCPEFGFTFTVPFGWVDRTAAFEGDELSHAEQDDSSWPPPREAPGSEVLLAVFERPPGAPGEATNSAVVIAVESLAAYKGVKTAADYFGPLASVAGSEGFRVVNEPYAFPLGMKQLVRGDFTKPGGKAPMWQSSLVTIAAQKILSFTFVTGSDEEADELIQKLEFRRQGGGKAAAPAGESNHYLQ
ncbi:MAG: hypothetical protein JO159_03530 [Acidobacteria bacterium]|nr:hypothetical protein [Acidobacteriota bacterium]